MTEREKTDDARQDRTAQLQQRKQRTVVLLSGVVAGMIGLSFASVPLYDLFCSVTGYGGTTGISQTEAADVRDETVTVRFNANVSRDMPWEFDAEQREMTVHLGEQNLAFYKATNLADHATIGTATFNVTPFSAGQYFQKVHCFCFDRQQINAGETVDLAVSFYVDPAILDDPDAKDAKTITLSYTYFPHPDEEERESRPQTAEAQLQGDDAAGAGETGDAAN